MKYLRTIITFILLFFIKIDISYAQPLRILNFYGDCGFKHTSQTEGIRMVEEICKRNNWHCITSNQTGDFTSLNLASFDVIVFNNNCGNEGRIFTSAQQFAFRSFIRNGGGFVGIHCAGAIWKEEGEFQQWYEQLVGTKLIDHPPVQQAYCLVEKEHHPITQHLPNIWKLVDEFHTMQPNPRSKVEVLLTVDEASYQGEPKMRGDHPIVWMHLFDGGKSFFSSLGHTEAIYRDTNYQKLIEQGIRWSGTKESEIPVEGLIVDLNADKGVTVDEQGGVVKWINQVETSPVKVFAENQEGRSGMPSGRPTWIAKVEQLNGHHALFFNRQELVSKEEKAFDHLITGSGYTWFFILKPGRQVGELADVNSFFGNLKNGDHYEGFWAGLNDDNRVWMGSRNGLSFGRWDQNNPKVESDRLLDSNRFYLLIGRMERNSDTARLSLFINDVKKESASGFFTINKAANASKLAIGQERDAINHPGKESFVGSIARFLLYERALTEKELEVLADRLVIEYRLGLD